MPQYNFSISGLKCAACVNNLSSKLRNNENISDVTINFANKSATINSNINATAIIKIIEESGYKATLLDNSTKHKNAQEHALKREYYTKILHSLLSLGTGFALMLAGSFGLNMQPNTSHDQFIWKIIAFIVLIIIYISARHFFKNTIKLLRQKTVSMDTLIALSTSAAFSYSLAVVLAPNLFPEAGRHLYFEASLMIIGFVNLGQALELKSLNNTNNAINKLLNLNAKEALVIRDNQEFKLPLEQVKIGDTLRVLAGEKIAVDGIVQKGESLVDESLLTGEASPVNKKNKAKVHAGTINLTNTLLYSATNIGEATKLAQIIALVRQAQNTKPPIGKLVDKISSVFVPSVITIALITATIWFFIAPAQPASFMLVTSMSVLIIACPCALGLATPISIMLSIAKAAKLNILVKDASALENLSHVDLVIFDKTGTLTLGSPQVNQSIWHKKDKLALYQNIIYSLEQESTHPLSLALINYFKEQNVQKIELEQIEQITARGIKAYYNNIPVAIGSAQLMQELNIELASNSLNTNASEVYFAYNNQLIASFAIFDPLRADARSTIEQLAKLNIRTVLLTGDNELSAKSVAEQLNLDEYRANLLPADKLDYILAQQNLNKKVAMIGDGINDAPALAQANVSFAIGTGSDIAIETADITLLSSNLNLIITAIRLSLATLKNIKQNLFGAFIYNIIAITLAAGIFYPFTGMLLSPIIASIAMSLSSISVITNANRLRLFK